MTIKVSTQWATPDGDSQLAYIARVSNLNAKPDDPSDRLIKYLVDHGHWSPFEMVNMCLKIECPRDISRQILRHRSFAFQEFSGRYSEFPESRPDRTFRFQDKRNRQNSIPSTNSDDQEWYNDLIDDVYAYAMATYNEILANGGAKEVARVVLPEGLTPTVLYMNGTVRSWIHYIQVRTDAGTQFEHRQVAELVKVELLKNFPCVGKVL